MKTEGIINLFPVGYILQLGEQKYALALSSARRLHDPNSARLSFELLHEHVIL
jgi:hypothetical protein